MNKAKCQIKHAKRRVGERFGLSLSIEQIQTLANRIKKKDLPRHKGKAIFVDRQSLRVSRWFVWHEDQWLPIVYDRNRKTVATILPEGALGDTPPPFENKKCIG